MKKMVQVILAAAAIVALAVPVMAANDKLIVKHSDGSTAFVVKDDAKIGIATGTPSTALHVVAGSADPLRGMTNSQHNDGAQGGVINFVKSRGTQASPTLLSTGDYIGAFVAQYWNGVAYDRSSQFAFRNDYAGASGPAVPGSTTLPTMIIFQTGASTQSGDPNIMTERFRISAAGNIVAGNSGGVATGTLPLTATDGFLYIPTTAGALTCSASTTTYVGHTPIWYDTTNNRFCTCAGSVRKCVNLSTL